MENHDITKLIESLIQQTGALDMATSEFKRMIHDDPELKRDYRQWCEEYGYTERHGFTEYAEEYISSREEIWDSLTDYDENV